MECAYDKDTSGPYHQQVAILSILGANVIYSFKICDAEIKL